jgi:hypothetical protein
LTDNIAESLSRFTKLAIIRSVSTYEELRKGLSISSTARDTCAGLAFGAEPLGMDSDSPLGSGIVAVVTGGDGGRFDFGARRPDWAKVAPPPAHINSAGKIEIQMRDKSELNRGECF